MQIEFHGAARTVTGSRHLLQVNGSRVLLDCGLFQGRRSESDRRNREFGFDPAAVDAVVLSHAHIDHSGALPSLARAGFRGCVHGTLATADLLTVMLRDSAHIQEKDVEFLNKRRRKGEPPKEPIYTLDDAEDAIGLLEGHRYHRPVPVAPGVTATFYDAGHILGSAVVQLDLQEGGVRRRLVFTGDLGRRGLPILRDPETPPEADALILESTYGDREHEPIERADERLADLIRRVFARGGKILIPAFAVGRTQELVFAISRLIRAGRIPGCSVYVDSPLAVDVTEIFARHPEAYDAEMRRVLRATGDPFGFGLLRYVRGVDESIALDGRPGPAIIISASGMMEAGRILHHLRHGIDDPRNAVLVVGYQAEHTLGRRLVEKREVVKIFGEEHRRRAEVVVMNEFSAHADRNEILRWVSGFQRRPGRAFVVHGEESQSLPLAERLRREAGIPDVVVPGMHQREPLG
jgi:metallo-beta-lactamase family protein